MASSVAPVPALFLPQSSTSSLDPGSALPMDWDDISVKDEPPDVLNGPPGELTAVNDDLEDSKHMITVNSLGEVHYLPAGSAGMMVTDPDSLGTRTVVGDLVPAGSTSRMSVRDPVNLHTRTVVGDLVPAGSTSGMSVRDPVNLHTRTVVGDLVPAGSTSGMSVGDPGSLGGSNVVGDMVPDGVTVKVEEDDCHCPGLHPLNVAHIKEEAEEAPMCGTVATSDLSYLDDPRWYMSPEDKEIDPESSYTASSEVITVEPSTIVQEHDDRVTCSTLIHEHNEEVTCSSGVQGGAGDKGGSKITKGKVACAKQGNVVMSQSVKGKAKHGVCKTTKGKAGSAKYRSKKWRKVGTQKVLPCVVQLCQVHHCGVDCRCTVKAPYPAKLNAVTISTEQNVMSLNRFKGSHKQQSKTTAQKPGSNMLAMSRAPNRTGLGKRLVKPSNKLKLYMEERNKKATKKEPGTKQELGTKNKFVCPICEKGFSYIFSFKQHIITHDVTEILNMNLPPKSKTILPKGEEETGTTETGLTETGATETAAAETGLTETGATETGATDTPSVKMSQKEMSKVETEQEEADQEEASQTNFGDSSASPPTRYKTLRTLLSDDAPQGSTDTECHQQVSALLGKGPTTPPSRKTRRKVKSPSEKMIASPGSKTSSSPKDTMSPPGEPPASTEAENTGSTKNGVVLKVPTFKPASQQQKQPQQKQPQNKKRKKAAEVEMSGSLGLGEVVMYEKGLKINEATFNVKDSTSSVPEETPGQTEGQGPCVDEQRAAVEPEQPAPVEPSTQRVIVIAPINDFSPQPGTDDCRAPIDFPPPVVEDCRHTIMSPKAKPNEGRKPVKRLKTKRAKPGLKVKLNIKQKLPAIKKSPMSAASSPPPLSKRSPTRAKSTPSPIQQIKTSPKTSPKSSPRAKPKAGALKGEKEEDDCDSDATSPYGDDNDDRDGDFSAADDDEDEDYVPNTNSKKGVLGRSASMMQWMRQFSVKKKQKSKYSSMGSFQALSKKKDGGKKGTGAPKPPTTTTSTATTSSSIRRGQSRSLGGRNAHSNNNNKEQQGSDGDMDSGIDLESDGSEQKAKKAAVQAAVGDQVVQKKSVVSDTARVLQMLNGQLVSRKELWACVQERLDDRKQKGAVQCPMCNKEFHYPSALKRHIMMHTDEREYQCPQCPKAFSRKPHLTEHIRVHTGERPFKCAHCPAAFAQRTNLKIHNRTHTGARPFKCPECGKRFRRQDAHTQHILTHHSKVKPYKCSQCAAAFPCARYLKDHLRVHSTERPFKCEMCPAAFVCKKYLLLHVRALHLNERPFCCKLCPAKFAQSGKLTEHNRVHTGERPYKCSSCGASFSRSGHLRRHLLTHTGVRPHQCTHCEASFSQQDHLKRHVRNIHNKDT